MVRADGGDYLVNIFPIILWLSLASVPHTTLVLELQYVKQFHCAICIQVYHRIFINLYILVYITLMSHTVCSGFRCEKGPKTSASGKSCVSMHSVFVYASFVNDAQILAQYSCVPAAHMTCNWHINVICKWRAQFRHKIHAHLSLVWRVPLNFDNFVCNM